MLTDTKLSYHSQQISCFILCYHVKGLCRQQYQWESFISLIISCTNIAVAPSNLNIILFVGMAVYSNPSKFQSDSTYNSRDDILKTMVFPYIFYGRRQPLTPAIENAWENHDF